MLITLFTDASFNRNLSRGTWAAWFKHEGKAHRYSGALRGSVTQSGDAELAAIANALYAISTTLSPPSGTRVICQTDSWEAISAIKSGKHPRSYSQTVVTHISTYAATQGWTLDLRHVNGHKGTRTRRNAVNTWCDRECKRRMAELLPSLAATNAPPQEALTP